MRTLREDGIRKVLAGLDLMGVPYDLKHVDYFKGEQKAPAYLAVNPNASVPALMLVPLGDTPSVTTS
mgnify:CR=1 FL=1